MNNYTTPHTSPFSEPFSSIDGLPPSASWVEPYLVVLDCGRAVHFHIGDILKYHGLDSVGGAILGFRLLQRAFAELSPEGPAERRELSLFTSFPGFGARDAFELVARMITDGRYKADPGFIDERAPEGVTGRCYFRFFLRGRSLELAPPPGVPNADFLRWGRASKQIGPDSEEYDAIMRRWRQAKFTLASVLLGLDCRSALRVLEPSFTPPPAPAAC